MNSHKQNNFRRWWDSLSITDRIFADGLSFLVWVCILFLAYFFITGIWIWWVTLLAWAFFFFMEIDADPYKYAWTFKEREEWDKQHPTQRGSVIIHGRHY